jgi:hypothetical protein
MTSMITVKVIVTGYKGASYPLQPMSDPVLMTTPCHRQPPGGNPQQAHLDFSDMDAAIAPKASRIARLSHDNVHGEPSYTCVTLYNLLIVALTQSSMLQNASLFPLSVVALSVATLLAAWARTSTEAQIPNHVVDVVAWKVSKALATLLLLGLAVFSAAAYESGTLSVVSSVVSAVRSP